MFKHPFFQFFNGFRLQCWLTVPNTYNYIYKPHYINVILSYLPLVMETQWYNPWLLYCHATKKITSWPIRGQQKYDTYIHGYWSWLTGLSALDERPNTNMVHTLVNTACDSVQWCTVYTCTVWMVWWWIQHSELWSCGYRPHFHKCYLAIFMFILVASLTCPSPIWTSVYSCPIVLLIF